jgi:hypothetical protein
MSPRGGPVIGMVSKMTIAEIRAELNLIDPESVHNHHHDWKERLDQLERIGAKPLGKILVKDDHGIVSCCRSHLFAEREGEPRAREKLTAAQELMVAGAVKFGTSKNRRTRKSQPTVP